MSHLSPQRRYPIPSRINVDYSEREQLPYVDEEYVLHICTVVDTRATAGI